MTSYLINAFTNYPAHRVYYTFAKTCHSDNLNDLIEAINKINFIVPVCLSVWCVCQFGECMFLQLAFANAIKGKSHHSFHLNRKDFFPFYFLLTYFVHLVHLLFSRSLSIYFFSLFFVSSTRCVHLHAVCLFLPKLNVQHQEHFSKSPIVYFVYA